MKLRYNLIRTHTITSLSINFSEMFITFSPYESFVRRESYVIVISETSNFRQKNSYSWGLVTKKWIKPFAKFRQKNPQSRGVVKIQVLLILNTEKSIDGKTSVRLSVCAQP